ncbi:SCO4402 family protein [Amycolatopsis cihanbeyliensis]
MTSVVRYPDMRANVVGAVRALADPEFQRRAWIRKGPPQPGFAFDFTFYVNVLDDVRMREDPAATIGEILRNQKEVDVMKELASSLESLFHELGVERTDEEYLASPLWKPVVAAAKDALVILEEDS